jgi:hypothetical protein
MQVIYNVQFIDCLKGLTTAVHIGRVLNNELVKSTGQD